MGSKEYEEYVERRLLEQYEQAQAGDRSYPDVMYLPYKPSDEFTESGLYVGWVDFINVQRDMRIDDVPLTTLYHTPVLHYASPDPELHQQAYQHLRYNASNHSIWSRAANTWRYHVLNEPLRTFIDAPNGKDNKIPGVAKRGREVLRAVLYDEFEEPSIKAETTEIE